MSKSNLIKYSLIAFLLLALLTGCGVLEQRLADGTAVAAGGEPGSLFSGGDDGEPVGEGGGMDEETALMAPSPLVSPTYTLTQEPESQSALATLTTAPTETPVPSDEGANTPTVPGYQFTLLYQTLTAVYLTEQVTATPTATIDEAEITPTVTSSPEPIEENVCNSFRLVAHVTYPIGAIVQPETYFYKSWQVQNTGNCTWNSNYALVYYDGFQLGGQSPLVFGGTVLVAPDQYVTLTLQMYTPPQPGTYYSAWYLRDSEGNLFGGGENGDEPLIVQVVVPGNTSTPFYTGPVTTAPPFTPGP